jgi:hypothetical protein
VAYTYMWYLIRHILQRTHILFLNWCLLLLTLPQTICNCNITKKGFHESPEATTNKILTTTFLKELPFSLSLWNDYMYWGKAVRPSEQQLMHFQHHRLFWKCNCQCQLSVSRLFQNIHSARAITVLCQYRNLCHCS